MKINMSRPIRPLILGDLARDTSNLPKLTDEQILDMQPASTQELLLKPVDEPYLIKNTWDANPHAKTTDEKVNKRQVDVKELIEHDSHRRVRQHSFGYKADRTSLIQEKNTKGYLNLDGSTLEKKDLAEQAFRYSQPSPLTNEQISTLTPIKKLEELPKEEKKSVLDWLKSYFDPEVEYHDGWIPYNLREDDHE